LLWNIGNLSIDKMAFLNDNRSGWTQLKNVSEETDSSILSTLHPENIYDLEQRRLKKISFSKPVNLAITFILPEIFYQIHRTSASSMRRMD